MALHFVSTSVLTSSDGIAFEHEEKKDTLDVRNATKANEVSRPLFEQLAEQNDKKQADRDAITKLIFAPPKALDEEEVEFYNDLEERQKKLKELRQATEEEELKHFRSAVADGAGSSKSAIPVTKFARQEKSEDATQRLPIAVKVKAKRKLPKDGTEAAGGDAVVKKSAGGDRKAVDSIKSADVPTVAVAPKQAPTSTASDGQSSKPAIEGLGLGAYCSDSE